LRFNLFQWILWGLQILSIHWSIPRFMECFLILDGSQLNGSEHNGHYIQVYLYSLDLVYSTHRDSCHSIWFLLSPSIGIEHLMLILTAIVFAIRSIQWNFSLDFEGMVKCGQIQTISRYRYWITPHSKRAVPQWGYTLILDLLSKWFIKSNLFEIL
jgi:hypothetical protein